MCLFDAAQKSDRTKMQWDYRGFPARIHGFNYSKGSLIILKDGLYYLFSKVSFRINCTTFKHEVILSSSRYSDRPISLMTDTRYTHIHNIAT